ncbi:MAG: hypothetical protein ACD_20C00400G0005 [uncultured bacterium]|nr:MAG: hypothetical protein ACD_20C00400G0005 [uncultured bacterium]HBH18398.1 hypothetical protein [Cyanobacteria bacterium UBA9579]
MKKLVLLPLFCLLTGCAGMFYPYDCNSAATKELLLKNLMENYGMGNAISAVEADGGKLDIWVHSTSSIGYDDTTQLYSCRAKMIMESLNTQGLYVKMIFPVAYNTQISSDNHIVTIERIGQHQVLEEKYIKNKGDNHISNLVPVISEKHSALDESESLSIEYKNNCDKNRNTRTNSDEMILDILELYFNKNLSQAKIAAKCKVSQRTVFSIINLYLLYPLFKSEKD